MAANRWCEALGIEPPRLAAVKNHPEANRYALLIVALLEKGGPMTLAEVADRFAEEGVAEARDALASLQRCRPARAPVYREGERYYLDPHDDDLGLWAFTLGLFPPRPRPERMDAARPPRPDPSVGLGWEEIDEAWTGSNLHSWSAQKLVLAVLDADGRALAPGDVVATVSARTRWHYLTEAPAKFVRHDSPVAVLPDGRWTIADDADDRLRAAREAVRDRAATSRRHRGMGPNPVLAEENRQRRARQAAEFARLKRVLLVGFPSHRPEAVSLLDVNEREIETFLGSGLAAARERLEDFDLIGAIGVRGLLTALDFDAGERRLSELGPPRKSRRLNRSGRTLKITTELLTQGSCNISRPFGSADKMKEYLREGQHTRLRRRLEADLKSLYALYEYGRLHGCVRLRWGFLDEHIPAPWVHRNEPVLYDLMRVAREQGSPLEVVVGTAPGWQDPWARAHLAFVHKCGEFRSMTLLDEDGYVIDEREVQRARIVRDDHRLPYPG